MFILNYLSFCFGSLKQYFSLYRAREREKEESYGKGAKNAQTPHSASTGTTIGPCLTFSQKQKDAQALMSETKKYCFKYRNSPVTWQTEVSLHL